MDNKMDRGFPISQFLNVIIRNKNVRLEDRTNLFPNEEMVWVFNPNQKDMFDLLIMLKIFKSRGQAKKNWKITGREIPIGWTQLSGLGKFRKELCIWNPTGIFSSKRAMPPPLRLHKQWDVQELTNRK